MSNEARDAEGRLWDLLTYDVERSESLGPLDTHEQVKRQLETTKSLITKAASFRAGLRDPKRCFELATMWEDECHREDSRTYATCRLAIVQMMDYFSPPKGWIGRVYGFEAIPIGTTRYQYQPLSSCKCIGQLRRYLHAALPNYADSSLPSKLDLLWFKHTEIRHLIDEIRGYHEWGDVGEHPFPETVARLGDLIWEMRRSHKWGCFLLETCLRSTTEDGVLPSTKDKFAPVLGQLAKDIKAAAKFLARTDDNYGLAYCDDGGEEKPPIRSKHMCAALKEELDKLAKGENGTAGELARTSTSLIALGTSP